MESIFGFVPGDPGRFSGVVHIHGSDAGISTGHQVPSSIPVVVCLELAPGRYSMYDFEVVDDDGLLFLSKGTESWWFQAVERSGLSPQVVELCAGMGGMGIGCSFLGGCPVVAVDHNTLAVEHLKANDHGLGLQLD